MDPRKSPVPMLEATVVGVLMDRPALANRFFEKLPMEQFGPQTYRVAKAIADLRALGREWSPQQVVEQLRVNGDLMLAGGGPFVFDCYVSGQTVIDPEQHIETLSRLYLLRDAWAVGNRLRDFATKMDATEWVSYAQQQVDRIAKMEAGTMPASLVYLSNLLDLGELAVDWMMPGLIPTATTTMITAEEGVGKSTIMRQIAVSAISGISPFEPQREHYEPVRTLLVNCEGSLNQLVRGLRAAWTYAQNYAPTADSNLLAVESHPEGVNLSEPHYQAWLHRLVREHKPGLLVVSPLYRITDADLNTEEGVRTWQRFFEPLVADGMSLVMEHHSPNAMDGHVRGLRPLGSSAIRRWFGQGVSMRHKVCTTHQESFCRLCIRQAQVELWRGSRDEEVRWPTYIKGEDRAVWWRRDEYAEMQE